MKIIGLGNALVDVLIQLSDESIIEKLGLPKGSMQLIQKKEIPRINEYNIKFSPILLSGGSAANTIHGLSKLGTKCSFIGKVGMDEYGDFYENDLKNAGVISSLFRSKTETGRAYTYITPDSERTFATFLGAAIELMADELISEMFKGYDVMHVEGYLVQNKKLIETAFIIAKEHSIKISLDLASYNVVEAHRDFLSRVIPEFVDIVFANEEESKAFTGKSPSDSLDELAAQCEIAIVKVGKDGSLIKSGNTKAKIGAIHGNVIDTTGAGDQYAAGFLHGYTEHQEIEQCGKLGALLAGAVISNYGARIPENLWPLVEEKAQKIID
jgi:sugar/nucleoside kinase (ribokinase family)